MDSLLSALGWFALGLFTVAVAVALWEHGQTQSRKFQPISPPPTPRVVQVDLNLDDAAPPVADDKAARQVALDQALGRTGQRVWPETEPMVCAGPSGRSTKPTAEAGQA